MLKLLQRAFEGFTGEVWSTFSFIDGHIFGTILAADMEENATMTVSPTEAGYGKDVRFPIEVVVVLFIYLKLYCIDLCSVKTLQMTSTLYKLWANVAHMLLQITLTLPQ